MSDVPTDTFNFELDYSIIDPSSQQPPPPPPSSVHGEVDEDDNHLPVDDSFHNRDVHYDSTNEDGVRQNDAIANNFNIVVVTADEQLASTQNDQQPSQILPSPQQPELTLREKLVLRERQQRIETERARLKRQFALSSTVEEMDPVHDGDGNHYEVNQPSMESFLHDVNDVNNNGQEFEEESTRAHPDEEEAVADEANRRLGFNMERFLRNSDSFHPELQGASGVDTFQGGETSSEANKGVVMERFLNDMVNANLVLLSGNEIHTDQIEEPHGSVSFDADAVVSAVDQPHYIQPQTVEFQQEIHLASAHPSFGEESATGVSLVSNASMRTETNTVRDEFFNAGDPPLYSTSSLENMPETDRASIDDASSRISDDEPRVLRLTEADMLEMAAIEEASIGNAPPSDRDDVESYSEIGELTDFGGSGGGAQRYLGASTFAGPDTPTTALESASQLSQRSAQRASGASAISSSTTNEHADVDIFTGNIDLIAPSESVNYFVASASASVAANPPSVAGRDDDDDTLDNESQMNDVAVVDGGAGMSPNFFSVNEVVPSSFTNLPSSDLGSDIVGVTDTSPLNVMHITNRRRQYNPNDSSIDGSRIEPTDQINIIDDFDFDKDEPLSHTERNDESFRNLPNNLWSPHDHIQSSAYQVGLVRGQPLVVEKDNTTVTEENENTVKSISLDDQLKCSNKNETCCLSENTPLLLNDSSLLSRPKLNETSLPERVIPKRHVALLLTLVLEIPVFLMIMGGSTSLCNAVGRGRYQLILSFLPLICAISGNAALQSRDVAMLTVECNSTPGESQKWFTKEITKSACHGIVVGIALGFVAYIASGMDIIFGVTILLVQLSSILSASLTGTLLPLLCWSIFKHETKEWSALFLTACQDVFGTFASIVLSHYIIMQLSAKDVDPADTCTIIVNP